MKQFHISRQDRRWLAAWLASNLACVCGVIVLIGLLQMESTQRMFPTKQASAAPADAASPTNLASGISVDPSGWRRTNRGWEHISAWHVPKSRPLAEIVVHQRQREPVWAQGVMSVLRSIPPLTFAMFQMTAIAAIVWIAETQKKTQPEISDCV